jgi:hypothetical protein
MPGGASEANVSALWDSGAGIGGWPAGSPAAMAAVLAGSRFVTVRILYLMLTLSACGLERYKSAHRGSWSSYLGPRGSLHGKEKVYGSIP